MQETTLDTIFGLDGAAVKTKSEKALSEKELLLRVQKGDREAYQQIIVRYMKTAYFIALGFIHNHQDALDISQESLIKAYRKINRYDAEKPFSPWFYKILKNLCIDHYKRRRRLNEVPLGDLQVLSCDKEDRDMKEVLWKGIAELPIDQREVIILRYFRQMSYNEIAELTKKPIGTVMSSLYYAKKKLKGILGKYLGFD
jgi:RNA polymerase sigma-70 factor (ECF subfamily)